tara:strand:- start:7805 stop:8758 length:954 start_codon:yes stop_codon:yes gene_type:complete
MKFRSGYKVVKTLRKYINGKPTNITKNNVSGQPDYIEKYLSDDCPVNPLPSGVTQTTTTPAAPSMPNPTQTGTNNYTVSFSEYVKGWTSFHSWIPESMVNMNGDFFTFKDGQLYKHHANDLNRNTFYGAAYDTELEFVSNDGPSDVKIFKTVEIEGDTKDFDVTITTDLDSGHINKNSFEKKEGFNYAYIRRNTNDEVKPELLSVQGIGSVVSIPTATTVKFSLVPSEISVGDALYKTTGASTFTKIADITAINKETNTLTVSSTGAAVNDYCFAAKPPIAESFGLKGYFANIRIKNNSTSKVEVYSVNSEVAKSFP